MPPPPVTGPAISTASAAAGAPQATSPTYSEDFATGPYGVEPFGGLRGLSRGRATAPAGRPLSSEPGVTDSGLDDAPFGEAPFGDAPFGGDTSAGTGVGVGPFGASPLGGGLASTERLAIATATAAAGRPTSVASYGVASARAIAPRGQPLNVTALLNNAVAEPDRVPTFGLRADWGGEGSFAHLLSEVTPVVTEFTVQRELASELPDDIGLVQGTAATKMTAILGGDWLPLGFFGPSTDPVKAFAPYRTDADLASTPVIGRRLSLTTGMQTLQGSVTQQRFTGTVSAFSPSSSSREVVLEGLDPVDQLRTAITQPAWGIDETQRRLYGENGYPARLNSQWMYDRILRANGFFASPPPAMPLGSSELILSATMHGGTLAETDALTSSPLENYPAWPVPPPETFTPPWAVGDHPFGMLAPNPDSIAQIGVWDLPGPILMLPGFRYAMSGWFRLPAADDPFNEFRTGDIISVNAVLESFAGLKLSMDHGMPQITITIHDGGGDHTYTYIPPTDILGPTARWVFLGCYFGINPDGSLRMSIYRGDTNTTGGVTTDPGLVPTITSIPPTGYWNPACPVQYVSQVPFTNFSFFYVGGEPAAGDWMGTSWNPTAYIDVGGNDWGGFQTMINVESYALIKELVAAEFGSFEFDEDGVPHVRTRAVARVEEVSETITAERSLADLVVRVDEATIRNRIDFETSLYAKQYWTTVFKAEDAMQFIIPGRGSVLNPPVTATFDLPLPENCAEVWSGLDLINNTAVPPLIWDHTTWSQASSNPGFARYLIYSASYLNNPTSIADGVLTFRIRQLNAFTMRLFVTNISVNPVRLATPDTISGTGTDATQSPGTAALQIPGRIVAAPDKATGYLYVPDSVQRYGTRSYDLGGSNVWRQDFASATALANSVLEWTYAAKPVLSEVDVPHNPLRKLHNVVTVVDPEGLGSLTGWIAGITTHYSDGGARDQLLIRPSSPPPGW